MGAGCFQMLSPSVLTPSPATISPDAPREVKLYAAVPKSRQADCQLAGVLVRDDDWYYIGLRQREDWAVSRAEMFGTVTKDTHVMLEVIFTPLGQAHFLTKLTGADFNHMPMLHKVWKKGRQDHGTWHFIGDIPLFLLDKEGHALVHSRWKEIGGNAQ